MRMTCPVCKKPTKIVDPYEHQEIKRASAWFARHNDAQGKPCSGSQMTAIDREPIPAA